MTDNTPCVYVQHKVSGLPMYLYAAADLGDAINLAKAVRNAFGVPAWVAGWLEVAHQPNATEQALLAINPHRRRKQS